jgi:hypothetical protein
VSAERVSRGSIRVRKKNKKPEVSIVERYYLLVFLPEK